MGSAFGIRPHFIFEPIRRLLRICPCFTPKFFLLCTPLQYCPTTDDKVKVLRDMIFPQCERLGQTIIFVRTRETARRVHQLVRRVVLDDELSVLRRARHRLMLP